MKNYGLILLIIISKQCAVFAQADTVIPFAQYDSILLPDSAIGLAPDTVVFVNSDSLLALNDTSLLAVNDTLPAKSAEFTTLVVVPVPWGGYIWAPWPSPIIDYGPWLPALPGVVMESELVRHKTNLLMQETIVHDTASVSIRQTNPKQVSTNEPGKKPEPPSPPLLPETTWYQAILPSPLRIKKS